MVFCPDLLDHRRPRSTIAWCLLAPRRAGMRECKPLRGAALGALSGLFMARNRVFRFLSWNVRGLNDKAKCSVVRAFVQNCKCGVVCFQESKISSLSVFKLRSFCGLCLRDFRSLDAVGSRGWLFFSVWNPVLFDCLDHWAGSFSLNVLLQRKADGLVLLVSNIYGPTDFARRSAFFEELKAISARAPSVWMAMGDFNTLFSVHDKNGTPSNFSEILLFREVINEIGLYDLPLSNRSFTRTNGRRNPTLERLDRAFVSTGWLSSFSHSTWRALSRSRSDHTPLILSAFLFLPAASLFRFEAFWL